MKFLELVKTAKDADTKASELKTAAEKAEADFVAAKGEDDAATVKLAKGLTAIGGQAVVVADGGGFTLFKADPKAPGGFLETIVPDAATVDVPEDEPTPPSEDTTGDNSASDAATETRATPPGDGSALEWSPSA